MNAREVAEHYAAGKTLSGEEIRRLQITDKSAWAAAVDEQYRAQITKSAKASTLDDFISKREQTQPPAVVAADSEDTRSRPVTRGELDECIRQYLIPAMSKGFVREIDRRLAPVVARIEVNEAAISESRAAGTIRAGFERLETVLAAPRTGKRNPDGSLTATLAVPPRAPKPPTAEEKLADLEAHIKALEEREYKGVWQRGANYPVGSSVTHAGSLWHAQIASKGVKPGDGSMWKLSVKKGNA